MTATGQAVSPPVPDPAAPGSAVQTPGALLQQERVRRGLSVQQSAEALHLDTWIIEAIETNHFLALGAPVYAKGYLRKYASLLGLAPDVIVARYEVLTDTPSIPTPVPVITTTPPPRPRWPKFIGWGVLGLIAIAIGFGVYELVSRSAVIPAANVAPTPQSVQAEPVSVAPTPVATTVEPSPSVATPVASEAAPVVRPTEPVAAAPSAARAAPPTTTGAGPAVRLRLEFSEPSWVEVYDADGQKLVYDIAQPGRPRVVSGAAPISVVVGLASAVSVQVNDQPIVVPRQANRDSTRFRVNADGSIR